MGLYDHAKDRGLSLWGMPSGPRLGSSLAILAAFAILLVTLPCQAQAIPPSQPTTQPVAAPSPQPPAAHRAAVTLDAGKLAVTADNSSLNQILRDIARLTGMTITGGVLDERVFGTYGPADTSTVLSALLNGTGSNMLLIQDSQQSPQQLILTPRQGGASPPSPSALRDPGEADLPPQLAPRTSRPIPSSPPQPAFNGALPSAPVTASPPAPAPAAAAPAPVSATTVETPAQPVADTPTPPPANATTQESPNGIKTPQQIYDQLIKLQQQQQANPPP